MLCCGSFVRLCVCVCVCVCERGCVCGGGGLCIFSMLFLSSMPHLMLFMRVWILFLNQNNCHNKVSVVCFMTTECSSFFIKVSSSLLLQCEASYYKTSMCNKTVFLTHHRHSQLIQLATKIHERKWTPFIPYKHILLNIMSMQVELLG